MSEEKMLQPQIAAAAFTISPWMQDTMGPLIVDQIIRQAVQYCWMALLKEEYSSERVEQEILRLVQRVLDDMKEDAVAFGLSSKQTPYEERLAKIRAKYPKAYEKWTEDEDNLLRQKFKEGANSQELSEFFERQPSAIRSRLVKLGLVSEAATKRG